MTTIAYSKAQFLLLGVKGHSSLNRLSLQRLHCLRQFGIYRVSPTKLGTTGGVNRLMKTVVIAPMQIKTCIVHEENQVSKLDYPIASDLNWLRHTSAHYDMPVNGSWRMR